MPRVKPKPKAGRRPLRDDEMCRAVESLYAELDGESFYIRTGMELRGDHKVVKNNPSSFMPSATPADEVLLWLPEPPEPVQYDRDFNIPQPPEIPAERQVIAVDWCGTTTRQVSAGTVLDVGDPLVALVPSNFVWHKRLTDADVEAAG